MVKLGINIDHVATLRQARRTGTPDVFEAAMIAEKAGADGITVHLREDRRHIQDADVILLRSAVKTGLNLEMAVCEEIVKIALKTAPDEACLVPEKRQEVTTEGGLDIGINTRKIEETVARLKERGVRVSLFVDPDRKQVELAKKAGADCVELHTGAYAAAKDDLCAESELRKLREAGDLAVALGLRLNAGHGLDYGNVLPVAKMTGMDTLNIGFSIISRALFTGLEDAVKEMKKILKS